MYPCVTCNDAQVVDQRARRVVPNRCRTRLHHYGLIIERARNMNHFVKCSDAVVESSIPAVLEARANLQPSDTAFTYVDYEQDWAGVAESLTWSQLYRRTSNIAQELSACGSTGDRAVILAPQGLDYVVAFLGALQAGLIAVPLSEPLGGASDERVSAVLRDAAPSAILTTSSIGGNVAAHIQLKPGESAPSIIELDLLDLDSQNGPAAEPINRPDIAYLQYTSGSTRTPAGAVISHKSMVANVEQVASGYYDDN